VLWKIPALSRSPEDRLRATMTQTLAYFRQTRQVGRRKLWKTAIQQKIRPAKKPGGFPPGFFFNPNT
jgi:hypothetical protein